MFIKRFLAGTAGDVVGALSIGVDSTAATLGDTRLGFEFGRIPVSNIAYDKANDRLVFKGSIPEEVSGKVYEVGLWTAETDSLAGNQASRLVTTFDADSEIWVPETVETTVARIGVDSLKHTPGASATSSSVMSELTMEFDDNSSADMFIFAYNVENSNTSTIQWRFRTDASNYYQFQVSTPTTGYKISSFTKGSATITGTPAWDDINEIEVRVTSTAGGSSAVEFDGIRIEDIDTVNPEYGLIARFVPGSPVTKADGLVYDMEFTLAVSV